MVNATLQKLNYPNDCLKDYDHWCVFLRPTQITLGALILGAKSDATSLSQLDMAAFGELKKIITDIEQKAQAFCPYQQLNYLALMMVDPHVHFHILPRYDTPQNFAGHIFTDSAWPAPLDVKEPVFVPLDIYQKLHAHLQNLWS